jgi:hypothetical protein
MKPADQQNEAMQRSIRQAVRSMPVAADASVVNRTHRVVRERATHMREARSRLRALWLPLSVSSLLLVLVCCALWTGLAQYDPVVSDIAQDITQNDTLDASSQMLVFTIWFLPISAVALLLLWFRRGRQRAEDEATGSLMR